MFKSFPQKNWLMWRNNLTFAPANSEIYSNKYKMKEVEAIKFVQDALLSTPGHPTFRAGDQVIVTYRIVEGAKTREQAYRGDVIQIKGTGGTRTFTVRKISHGVGVERVFAFTNPNVAKIEVVKRGHVRRSRLYYLRDLVGKKARIRERKQLNKA